MNFGCIFRDLILWALKMPKSLKLQLEYFREYWLEYNQINHKNYLRVEDALAHGQSVGAHLGAHTEAKKIDYTLKIDISVDNLGSALDIDMCIFPLAS